MLFPYNLYILYHCNPCPEARQPIQVNAAPSRAESGRQCRFIARKAQPGQPRCKRSGAQSAKTSAARRSAARQKIISAAQPQYFPDSFFHRFRNSGLQFGNALFGAQLLVFQFAYMLSRCRHFCFTLFRLFRFRQVSQQKNCHGSAKHQRSQGRGEKPRLRFFIHVYTQKVERACSYATGISRRPYLSKRKVQPLFSIGRAGSKNQSPLSINYRPKPSPNSTLTNGRLQKYLFCSQSRRGAMAGVLQLSAVSIVAKHREWRSNEGCGQKAFLELPQKSAFHAHVSFCIMMSQRSGHS